jgi:hypothetical protein
MAFHAIRENKHEHFRGWFVVTYNGSICNFYWNGSLEYSVTAAYSGTLYNTETDIGASYGRYFQGLIDDVRIYNRVLSAAQIQAMYAGGK